MPGDLLLLIRIILAAVFALAGATKLLDPAGSRDSLREFGVPAALTRPAAVLLPAAELLVAVALLSGPWAWLGALGAAGLLAAFTAAIAASLARGRRPDCHCFGQLHSAPVGRATLARNGALLALSAAVVVAGRADAGPGLFAWLAALTGVERALAAGGTLVAVVLGIHSALLVRILRQQRELLARPVAPAIAAAAPAPGGDAALTAPAEAGLPAGTPAPAFALRDLDDRVVSLDALRARGRPVLLLFSDPGCGPCSAMLPEVAGWQRDHAQALTVAVISRGTRNANRAKAEPHGLSTVLLQKDREVAEAYGLFGTPSALVVLADGTVATLLAQGDAAIRQLVAQVVREDASRAMVGQPAPRFALPDLGAATVSLDDFHGSPVLVLFWNPACGYCGKMLDDLKAWEARTDRPGLVVISTGAVDANRAQGIASRVLLDPGFTVAAQYGVRGTPSAALVDAEGRLSAPVAVGADAIFALAGQASGAAAAADTPAEPPAPFPDGARPRKQECVEDELLSDGSLVAYHGCQGRVHTLNQTAALVWEYCDGEHDLDAIAVEVRAVFPAVADVRRDVGELVDALYRADLIVPHTVPVRAEALDAAKGAGA